jgi:hypothetical protein
LLANTPSSITNTMLLLLVLVVLVFVLLSVLLKLV